MNVFVIRLLLKTERSYMLISMCQRFSIHLKVETHINLNYQKHLEFSAYFFSTRPVSKYRNDPFICLLYGLKMKDKHNPISIFQRIPWELCDVPITCAKTNLFSCCHASINIVVKNRHYSLLERVIFNEGIKVIFSKFLPIN